MSWISIHKYCINKRLTPYKKNKCRLFFCLGCLRYQSSFFTASILFCFFRKIFIQYKEQPTSLTLRPITTSFRKQHMYKSILDLNLFGTFWVFFTVQWKQVSVHLSSMCFLWWQYSSSDCHDAPRLVYRQNFYLPICWVNNFNWVANNFLITRCLESFYHKALWWNQCQTRVI